MNLFKLIFKFNKYVFTADNPLSFGYVIVPFLIFGILLSSISLYGATSMDEKFEFLTYSPLPYTSGKLKSLAYISAVNGDVVLGRYFYQLALDDFPTDADDFEILSLLYPEIIFENRLESVQGFIKMFPTSRDLYILQAQMAKAMNDSELFDESINQLMIIDPNNPVVLGLYNKKPR